MVSDHEQAVTVQVADPSMEQCYLMSVVHGGQSVQARRELWEALIITRTNRQDMPWIVGGDFNVLLRADERAGGDLPIQPPC